MITLSLSQKAVIMTVTAGAFFFNFWGGVECLCFHFMMHRLVFIEYQSDDP